MGKKRSKQIPSDLLEDLPNEIFIAIFSYLNGVDAVFAFSNLNNRFRCLLFEYCQSFDFKSINKAKFDLVFQQHDTQQCRSLQLSDDDDDTPGQIEYFCQSYSLVENFPQLQSFSMVKMKNKYRYSILLHQFRSLTNLNSLTIESICGTRMFKFNLPKLKRLVLGSCRNTKWIQDFSQLEILEYTMTNCCSCQAFLTWPLTLKQLKIICEKDENLVLIRQSLVHLSQLITLEIYQKDSGRSRPNGESWENFIRSSLPLLQNFKFYFQFEYNQYSFHQVDQIIASFSTPFYVFEKSWFVRCDVCQTYPLLAAIYTVPFAFDRFTIFTNSFDKSISTSLIDNNNGSNNNIYAKVKTLVFEDDLRKPDENFNRTDVVNVIVNSHFNSINWIHVLTKLCHLEIKSGAMISSENFRLLLDNTPHLHSLAAEKSILSTLTENWSNLFICNHLSRKIRSLKLYKTEIRFRCMSRNELQQIIRIFSSKCQHLSIYVQSPNNTISFILRNMFQLHSLHVNITGKHDSSIDMIWLEKQQTKYNHSNSLIVKEESNYYFWLGKTL